MCIRFVGAQFTNYLCIGDLFPPIHRDVSVVNDSKFFHTPDTLVVWSIGSFAYALAQSSELIGVKFIPNFLILGMFLQLSIFEGLSCFFIKYGHCPDEEKLAQVIASWGFCRGYMFSVCERVRCVTGSVGTGTSWG